jgi:antitoxin (DNA-binding transcriptional repressor) of toxin-antitoxin stability system
MAIGGNVRPDPNEVAGGREVATTRRVDVEQLRARLDELLDLVQNEGTRIDLTRHGQLIARLAPPDQVTNVNATWVGSRPTPDEIATYLERHDQLARAISAKWPKDVSAADAINDIRREL